MHSHAQNTPNAFPLLDWSPTGIRLLQGPTASLIAQELSFGWLFGLAPNGSRVAPCPVIYHGRRPQSYTRKLTAWADRQGLDPDDRATFLSGAGIPGTPSHLTQRFEAAKLAKVEAQIARCLIVFDIASCWKGGDDMTPFMMALVAIKKTTSDAILATYCSRSLRTYFSFEAFTPEDISFPRPSWLFQHD